MSHLSLVPSWSGAYEPLSEGDEVLVLVDDEDEDPQYTALTRRILDMLRASLGSKGTTRGSVAQMAEKLGITPSEVWEHLEELLALGYIKRTHVYGVFTIEDSAPAPLPPVVDDTPVIAPRPKKRPGPKPQTIPMGEPLPDPFPVPPVVVAMNVITRMRVDRGRPEMTAEELLPHLERARDRGLSPDLLARMWFAQGHWNPRDPYPVKRFINHIRTMTRTDGTT